MQVVHASGWKHWLQQSVFRWVYYVAADVKKSGFILNIPRHISPCEWLASCSGCGAPSPWSGWNRLQQLLWACTGRSRNRRRRWMEVSFWVLFACFQVFLLFFLVNFKQISDERGSFLPSVMFLGLLRRAMEEGKSGKVINVNIF